MLAAGLIRYLTRDEIDTEKWDAAISRSANGLIYGYSFYLDHMAAQWGALIRSDYEAVMPITWNKKYGIAYLYQPFLTAQLGVFGNDLTAATVTDFLQAVPPRFRYWDIYLNHRNLFAIKGFHLYERANFVLDLATPYEVLYKSYRENIQRNIKKSAQLGCTVVQDIDVEKVIELAVLQMRDRTGESNQNITRFRQLFAELHKRGQAITYGILSARGQLLSSCVFFFSHNRAYYILVGNHPDGRTLGASHALIDAFIKDYSGKSILLDFEGSDIRNLAFFYSSFGAKEEKFAGLKINKLPFYLKWLKK